MAEASTTASGLPGAGGGLANFGANAAMAGISFGLNAMSTSKAHDRQKNMITRGPTYMMEGLRTAGINPILAAGSSGLGGSAAKAPQAGSATVSGVNATQAALNAKQMGLVDAQIGKTAAETAIVNAGLPEATARGAYYSGTEGARTLRLGEINRALPNTWSGMTSRGLYSGYQSWAENARKQNERMTIGVRKAAGTWLKNARSQNDWIYNRAQRLRSYFVDERE